MRYYIIAGEASGDLHGANLIKGLKASDPQADFRFWGGDLMLEAAGSGLVRHYKDNAIMGFVEVLMKLRQVGRNLKFCKEDLVKYTPDVVILIDYPGFNFRIAEFAKKKGIKVFYYIAPKVWAWKEKRVEKLKKYVDRLFIIFPFEIDYFKSKGIDAIYEGNPLLDSIAQKKETLGTRDEFLSPFGFNDDRKVVALLAGSRRMEIDFLFPKMLKLVHLNPDKHFLLAAAPGIDPEIYNEIIRKKYMFAPQNLKIVYGETYRVLAHSDAAIISSGTASLEAALFRIPQAVCYGASRISFAIARHLVKIRYISLANLILDRQIFQEILQDDCTADNINRELGQLLNNANYRNKMLADYDEVIYRLSNNGNPEGASLRIARRMIQELSVQ